MVLAVISMTVAPPCIAPASIREVRSVRPGIKNHVQSASVNNKETLNTSLHSTLVGSQKLTTRPLQFSSRQKQQVVSPLVRQLLNRIRLLESKINDLQLDLDVHESKLNEIVPEVDDTRILLSPVLDDVSKVKTEVEKLEAESKNAKAEISSINSDLKAETENATAEISSIKSELGAVKSTAEKSATKAQSEIEKLRSALEILLNITEANEKTINAMKKAPSTPAPGSCCEDDKCRTYRGEHNRTKNQDCVSWSEAGGNSFPTNLFTEEHYDFLEKNFCRNPDHSEDAWCWVPSRVEGLYKKEYCNLPRCAESERDPKYIWEHERRELK